MDIENSNAIAVLYGEPLFDIPKDLYIPPDALEICLDKFEGPLDLLLYVIKRQNFNILDIPMSALTSQYINYINQIKEDNEKKGFELAAEYLLMAATLIDIKARMLLPKEKEEGDETEPQDPRAELVKRLLEYEQMRKAAQNLDNQKQVGRDIWVATAHLPSNQTIKLPDIKIEDLYKAWINICTRQNLKIQHKIAGEILSVREFMSHVLRNLENNSFLIFEEIILSNEQNAGKAPQISLRVVVFMAILELAKESLVDIAQAEAFAPLYVKLVA